MPVAAAEKTRSAHHAPGYMSVHVDVLRRTGTTAVDVFLLHDAHGEPVLYRQAGHPIEPDHWHDLATSGVEQLYVRDGDFAHLSNDLLDSLETFIQQDSVPPTERYAALQVAVSFEIEHALRLVDCGRFLAVADRVGRNLTTLLTNNQALPRELFRIARHDFYTFTHVTNTACYSLLLAERLGIRDEDELQQIAVGATLHDIGKRFIPNSVLTKPSSLSTSERELINTHPQRGYEELCGRPELGTGQLMMVYQHHERLDGSGYPVGVLGDEIHPWAKLLMVVDVFEAMTGRRHYRRPATASEALYVLKREAGTKFDSEAVACWTAAIETP